MPNWIKLIIIGILLGGIMGLIATDGKQTSNYNFNDTLKYNFKDTLYYIKENNYIFIEADIPLYRVECELLVTDNLNLAAGVLNLRGDDSIDSAYLSLCSGLTVPTQGGSPIIWIRKFNNSAEDISVLNHEILHATFCILLDRGLTVSIDSEEAFTYLLQYISLQFYTNLLNNEQQNKEYTNGYIRSVMYSTNAAIMF